MKPNHRFAVYQGMMFIMWVLFGALLPQSQAHAQNKSDVVLEKISFPINEKIVLHIEKMIFKGSTLSQSEFEKLIALKDFYVLITDIKADQVEIQELTLHNSEDNKNLLKIIDMRLDLLDKGIAQFAVLGKGKSTRTYHKVREDGQKIEPSFPDSDITWDTISIKEFNLVKWVCSQKPTFDACSSTKTASVYWRDIDILNLSYETHSDEAKERDGLFSAHFKRIKNSGFMLPYNKKDKSTDRTPKFMMEDMREWWKSVGFGQTEIENLSFQYRLLYPVPRQEAKAFVNLSFSSQSVLFDGKKTVLEEIKTEFLDDRNQKTLGLKFAKVEINNYSFMDATFAQYKAIIDFSDKKEIFSPKNIAAMIPKIGHWVFTGFSSWSYGKNEEPIPEWSFKKVELNVRNQINGIPSSLYWHIDELHHSLIEGGLFEHYSGFAKLGYTEFHYSGETDFHFDEEKKSFSLTDTQSIRDFGQSMFKLQLGNVESLIFTPHVVTMAFAAMSVTGKSIELTIEDKGGRDRVIAKMATNRNETPEEFKAFVSDWIVEKLDWLPQNVEPLDYLKKDFLISLGSFLNGRANQLTFVIVANDPDGIRFIDLMPAMDNLEDLISKLTVEIGAKP